MRRLLLYLDVIRRLGVLNVAYVAWYRLTLKSGIRKWFFPQQTFASNGSFFSPVVWRAKCPADFQTALLEDADKIIQGQLRYYAYHWKTVGNPPNWFLNPFNSQTWQNPRQHWTTLDDFNVGVGDIKNVWEASRFEWVVTLARAYAASGDGVYLDTLNQWLADWARQNPVNTGPNWKCGQEAAIRVFNLLLAAHILKQAQRPRPALQEFVCRHLERISANIHYALAQDNNHGTSEAAALFIGGLWLAKSESCSVENLDSRLHGNDRAGSVDDNVEAGAEFFKGLSVGSGNEEEGSGDDRRKSGRAEGVGGNVSVKSGTDDGKSLNDKETRWKDRESHGVEVGSGNCRVGRGNEEEGGGDYGRKSGRAEGVGGIARESRNGGSNGNRKRKVYDRFARQGRKWLENRVRKLVAADGSFSQHSVTYHRVLLDTLIYVEFWRRQFDAAPFSGLFYRRAQAALGWLRVMTDPLSGNAPNLGSNDGAMLLHVHSCDYRDFRPSIQTAASLFWGRRLFPAGPWDEPAYWLGVNGSEVYGGASGVLNSVVAVGTAVAGVLPDAAVGADSAGIETIGAPAPTTLVPNKFGFSEHQASLSHSSDCGHGRPDQLGNPGCRIESGMTINEVSQEQRSSRKDLSSSGRDEARDGSSRGGAHVDLWESGKHSRVLPGGYVIMAGAESWALLRLPVFRFRPGHNDVFHFDLWHGGVNICRDDGSYSYHPEDAADADYYGSVKAHNTVGFDDGEQMPRLGRFLLGQWVAPEYIGEIEAEVKADFENIPPLKGVIPKQMHENTTCSNSQAGAIMEEANAAVGRVGAAAAGADAAMLLNNLPADLVPAMSAPAANENTANAAPADDGGCWHSWTGAYRDWRGNRHQRRVRWKENTWIVEDRLSGPFEEATLRYRLAPGDCRLEGHAVLASWGRIEVSGSDADLEVTLVEGMESLYYQHKQPVDTLVVKVLNIGKDSDAGSGVRGGFPRPAGSGTGSGQGFDARFSSAYGKAGETVSGSASGCRAVDDSGCRVITTRIFLAPPQAS